MNCNQQIHGTISQDVISLLSPILISLDEEVDVDNGIEEELMAFFNNCSNTCSSSSINNNNINDSLNILEENLTESFEIPNNQLGYYVNFFEDDELVIDFKYDEKGDKILLDYMDEFWFDDEGDQIITDISLN